MDGKGFFEVPFRLSPGQSGEKSLAGHEDIEAIMCPITLGPIALGPIALGPIALSPIALRMSLVTANPPLVTL